jgi:hypothetical protein
MPVLGYLLDTNVLGAWVQGDATVKAWLDTHSEEVAISTLSLAEMRRGIELLPDSKAQRELERKYRFILEDYRGCIWVFDEAAAMEWGRLMAEADVLSHPLPYGDSLIGAVARSMAATVATRNIKHFPGCATVNPWTGMEHPAWQPT